jgi:ribosomal protein S18 acetylase RimI-like enzyme
MSLKLRRATRDDAEDIARLADIAGEGFPGAIWESTADAGKSAFAVGTAKAASDEGIFSWTHATMAEIDGKIAGMAVSYLLADTPEVIDEQTHPMYRPMIKLENEALQTRYVSMLATYPTYRKSGVAEALLDQEERVPGPMGMSLITSDYNVAARAFLTGRGFREAAVVPAIKINWDTPMKSWHLLRKP